MLKICVDTSYLISFADDSLSLNHSTAVDYFRHCVANGYLLCLSTLVVSEFEVAQPASDLPLQHFHIVPFNFRHAVRSADYHKIIKGLPAPDAADRHVVRNDFKILAQADIEQCQVILTEDANTLTRWAVSWWLLIRRHLGFDVRERSACPNTSCPPLIPMLDSTLVVHNPSNLFSIRRGHR